MVSVISLGVPSSSSRKTLANNPYDYRFEDYLSQVPDYQRQDPSRMRERAATSSNLIFDPQRSEQQRQAQWQEAQHINALQKLKAGNVGVNEALSYNDQQMKKAAAVRAAGSGAIGSSGLSDYLKNAVDASTQAQRLNIAAQLAAGRESQIRDYGTLDRQTQQRLAEIEKLRGETSSNLYGQYQDAQDAAEQAWRQNALQVALAIGSGKLQASELSQKEKQNQDALNMQKYNIDMGMKQAMLPYQAMTKAQAADAYLQSANVFGQAPGSGSSAPGYSGFPSTSSSSGSIGLRSYAEGLGKEVGYDPNTGNVTIGSQIITPATLAAAGGVLNNGTWTISESMAKALIR